MISFTLSIIALIIGYFLYGRFVERVFGPDDRVTPAVSTDHPHTMTELSQLMPEKIDALLQQIGLTFEVEEQPFNVEEFKKNIMRYF